MSGFEPFERIRPLDDLEVALVRASLAAPGALPEAREASLRWAISLARIGSVGGVALEEEVAPLRERVLASVRPTDLAEAARLAPRLAEEARLVRAGILERHAGALDAAALDAEVREKKLVLALGGGGGTAYSFLGAFALLEDLGATPSLISATSMGAVLGLFRARALRHDPGVILGAIRSMSWSRLFRVLSTESRYGLPAALRLYLRSSLHRHVRHEDGRPFTFRDLPIPMLVTLSGIRRGALPHPISYYESLVDPRGLVFKPWLLRSRLGHVARASEELASPKVLEGIHVGLEDWTNDFDVLDAVGFSCAVPGLIHYDVLRADDRMHDLLGTLFDRRSLFRLVDGGLTQNVPAQAAWQAVQAGRIGTRNALILALDGFAPRLSTPLWLPLQRVAAENARPAGRYAHVLKAFQSTPSPTDLIPTVSAVVRAVDRGRSELAPEIPLVGRLLRPLPPLEALPAAA
ncbi:MAG TPA: patatin-like phospholipase family protein [Vulgatibacter sp.]|nr:patatin-like phospholipase family protein [Vulgatibacter sp.]